MTLGLGVLCDEGVVLLTDSVSLRQVAPIINADPVRALAWGAEPTLLSAGKFFPNFEFFEQFDFSAAYAGFVQPGHGYYMPSPSPDGWQDTSRRFIRNLKERGKGISVHQVVDLGRGPFVEDDGHQIVIAPRERPAAGPLLGYLDSDGREEWLETPGMLACGGWRDVFDRSAQRHMAVPADLEAAADLGGTLMGGYIRQCYGDQSVADIAAANGGAAPWFAFPLHRRWWRWTGERGQDVVSAPSRP